MTTENQDTYELLKQNLYQDDAIIGEAAGLSMGLVMMGEQKIGKAQHHFRYFSIFCKFSSICSLGKAFPLFCPCPQPLFRAKVGKSMNLHVFAPKYPFTDQFKHNFSDKLNLKQALHAFSPA